MNGTVAEKRGWHMEVRARYGDRETAERVFRTLARSGLFADGPRLVLLGPDAPEVLPPRCRISSW